MANPTQSDLHVNIPLTNVSIRYKQNSGDFLADRVFPKCPVNSQSNLYTKYSKSDWRKTRATRRASATESAGTGWNTTTDSYFAHVYAVHHDIDDQKRANADSIWHLDKNAAELVTNDLQLKRDLDWNANYFAAGKWATEYAGGTDFTKWDDAGSDPIGDFQKWKIAYRLLTGTAPNKAVFGAEAMAALLQHPDIIDRIKFTQRGIVTEELLAVLFGVGEIITSWASIGTGPDIPDAKAQDAATDYSFLSNSTSVLLAYAPPAPSLETPSAGYTFTWSDYVGGNNEGIRIKKFRQEAIASDRVEGEMTYDMKVVCPDMGVYISDAVVSTL